MLYSINNNIKQNQRVGAVVFNFDDESKNYKDLIQKYDLHLYILYNSDNKILSRYIQEYIKRLDVISGEKVLIILFEQGKRSSKYLKNKWKLRLGDLYDKIPYEWLSYKKFDEEKVYKFIHQFNLPVNQLPMIVVSEPDKRECFWANIPKCNIYKDYNEHFEKLINILIESSKSDKDKVCQFSKKWIKEIKGINCFLEKLTENIECYCGYVDRIEASILSILNPILESFSLNIFNHLK